MSFIDTLSRPRTLAALLAVSVGANLFLAGIVAGRIGADMMGPPPFARGFEHSMRFIPKAQRADMLRHAHEMMPQMKETHRAMQRLHRQLAEELAKPTPDRAIVEKQLADIRARMQTTQEMLHRAFVDTVLALPPAERRAMLDHMMEARGGMMMRGPRHGGGHGAPPGMPPVPPDAPAEPPPAAPQDAAPPAP